MAPGLAFIATPCVVFSVTLYSRKSSLRYFSPCLYMRNSDILGGSIAMLVVILLGITQNGNRILASIVGAFFAILGFSGLITGGFPQQRNAGPPLRGTFGMVGSLLSLSVGVYVIYTAISGKMHHSKKSKRLLPTKGDSFVGQFYAAIAIIGCGLPYTLGLPRLWPAALSITATFLAAMLWLMRNRPLNEDEIDSSIRWPLMTLAALIVGHGLIVGMLIGSPVFGGH